VSQVWVVSLACQPCNSSKTVGFRIRQAVPIHATGSGLPNDHSSSGNEGSDHCHWWFRLDRDLLLAIIRRHQGNVVHAALSVHPQSIPKSIK